MNILDENVIDSQRIQLRSWHIAVRQIGYEIGWKGMQDREIIPLLHQENQPTFFTRDSDFYYPKFCHARYCLVFLDVRKQEVALFVRRLLRHPDFNTKAKRMSKTIRVSHIGISFWQLHHQSEAHREW